MKTMLVLGLLTLLPVLGDLQGPATAAAEKSASQRTVTVSLQRIASESIDGRAANQRLQALAQKMAADLAAKQKELAPSGGQDLQRLAQQSQLDFANTQRQVQSELRSKLNPIVAEIAAQRGADVVLNADTLVWASPRLDITHDVLSKLDAQSSAGK